jgi:hypothetical protein
MSAPRVRIQVQLFSGTLGEGWRDQYAAAQAYGAYLEGHLADYLEAYCPGAIACTVEVQVYRGCGGPARVEVEPDIAVIWRSRPYRDDPPRNDPEYGHTESFSDVVQGQLQPAWDGFCETEGTDALWATDTPPPATRGLRP